jgi:TRAP-type uncharacterized transport system substrate-binding protein
MSDSTGRRFAYSRAIDPSRRIMNARTPRCRLIVPAVALAALSSGCVRREPPPTPPRPIVRVITGTPGGGLRPLAESLAEFYQRALPDVTVRIEPSPGAVANVEAIQRGDADLGFVFADEQAPGAPIPLHEGAARYYRERELRR